MPDLLPLLLGSLGSLIVLILGSKLAESKRVREQVWDRKALAYSDILEALEGMHRYLETSLIDAMCRNDRPADEVQRRWDTFSSAKLALSKAVARQSWILPTSVQDHIVKLESVFDTRYDSWEEDLDHSTYACREARNSIRTIAKEDLVRPSIARRIIANLRQHVANAPSGR